METSVVPFSDHGQVTVDLTVIQPQDVRQMVAKVESIAQQEKMFPINLHAHRTNFDKVSVQIMEKHSTLVEVLQRDFEADKQSGKPNADVHLDAIGLLKDEFEALVSLAHKSEATMSKQFSEYKDLLYEQFSAMAALQHANLCNSIALWRNNWTQQQQARLQTQNTLTISASHAKDEFITKLQRDLSSLTSQRDLLVTEKKTILQKVTELQSEANVMKEKIEDQGLSQQQQEKEKQVLEQAVQKLQTTIKDMEKSHAADNNVQSEKVLALTTKLNERNLLIAGEAKRIDALVQKLQATEVVLKDEDAKAERLSQNNARLEKENEVILVEQPEWQQSLATLTARYNAISKDHEIAESELAKSKKTIEELQRKGQESTLARERDRLGQLEAIKSLKKQVSDYKALQEKTVQENNDLTKLLAEREEELATLKASNAELQKVESRFRLASPLFRDEVKLHKKRISELEKDLENIKQTMGISGNDSSKAMPEASAFLVAAGPDAKDKPQEVHDLLKALNLLEEENRVLQGKADGTTNDQRVAKLQQQLAVYQELLDQENKHSAMTHKISAQLHESGLHKDSPSKSYVSASYFQKIQHAPLSENINPSAAMDLLELSMGPWDC